MGKTNTPPASVPEPSPAAAKSYTITDSKGRVLTLAKPHVLAQFDLVELIGGAAASNETYMGMVLPVIYVCAIDGEPVPPPTTKRELSALISQLDEHGLKAAGEGIEKYFITSEQKKLAAAKK